MARPKKATLLVKRNKPAVPLKEVAAAGSFAPEAPAPQIKANPYAKPLTYRGRVSDRARLEEVFSVERGANPRLKQAQILEYIVGLGVELYWARNDLNARMAAVAEEFRDTSQESLVRILEAGLNALEKEK